MKGEGNVPTARGMEEIFESREHQLVERLMAPLISPAVESGLRCLEKENKALLELISIARSAEGRPKLAELRIVPSLVVLLQQFPLQVGRRRQSISSSEERLGNLTLLLKLARNLCAGDSTNQDALLDCGGVGILGDIAGELLHSVRSGEAHPSEDFDDVPNVGTPGRGATFEQIMSMFESNSISRSPNAKLDVAPPVGCLQLMVQLLANFAQRGEPCQAAVWKRFFPLLLLRSMALRVEGIRGPLCMLLYVCCKSNSTRCWELCQGFGSALVALVTVSSMDIVPVSDDASGTKASSSSEQIEWLELLVQHLCFREPLFPLLFVNFGVPPLKRVIDHNNANADDVVSVCRLCLESSTFTSAQAILLYILCDCLSFQTSNNDDGGVPPMPLKTMCFMVDILRIAAQRAVKDAEISPVPVLPSASYTVQILGFVLSVWRILFAWDSTRRDRTQLTTLLLSYGFVELLLGLLKALGPPEVPGKGDTVGMALENRLDNGGGEFPGKNPYLGYRRDIVALIANFSHENSLFQDRVRENGGLLLVLQNCVVERKNPFLREWSLWAMRNLLEGNERNQAEISQLEVKESVNLPELRRMGLNVQIDPNTRRPRLVNESASGLHP